MDTPFANRLKKNLSRLDPWARREGTDAYRLYDRDIKEVPWAVDRYADQVLLSEYVTPVSKRQSETQRRQEEEQVVATVREVLGTAPERIHLKRRERHRSVDREARGDPTHELVVHELGRKFLVNLVDYLDTGLFFDHRPLRKRVGRLAKGKRVLNLFCYTGAFTVHAAAGGASRTVSVDLSPTYLAWAERNLALNGLSSSTHELVRDDCFDYLRRTPESFDLIVLDPPTLSRSAKGKSFDVQRNHVELVNLALGRLAPSGTLFFSTNYRQFQLDVARLDTPAVKEITKDTLPEDVRDELHRCWELRR